MSLFTTIRDFVQAPMTSFIAFDPILNKLKTGKFNLSVASYKERVAAGVHELYKEDRLAQKVGIKESSVVKVAVIAGYVVAAYFTVGLASGAFSGGTGASAGDVYQGLSVAESLNKANQQKKAAADQKAAQEAAQAQALAAEQQAAIAAKLNAKPSTPVSTGAILSIIAIAAALLS